MLGSKNLYQQKCNVYITNIRESWSFQCMLHYLIAQDWDTQCDFVAVVGLPMIKIKHVACVAL